MARGSTSQSQGYFDDRALLVGQSPDQPGLDMRRGQRDAHSRGFVIRIDFGRLLATNACLMPLKFLMAPTTRGAALVAISCGNGPMVEIWKKRNGSNRGTNYLYVIGLEI